MSSVISQVNKEILPFCALLIGFVCVQAVLFLRHALSFNKKYNLFTQDEIKTAIKTSAIISVGPSMSVMVVVLSLIPLLGAVVTFMRCGVIGAADFELMNAKLAMECLGASFDDPNLTASAFTVGIFGAIFASAPYFPHVIITCKPFDKMAMKSATKKRSFLPILGMAASLGFIAYWALDTGRKSTANTISIIASLAVSFLVAHIAKKFPKLADWSMAIALIVGMAVGSIVNSITAA